MFAHVYICAKGNWLHLKFMWSHAIKSKCDFCVWRLADVILSSLQM